MARLHRLAVTPGEPAGIGPDLCLRIAQKPLDLELVMVADPALLRQRARRLGLRVELVHFDPECPRPSGRGRLSLMDIPMAAPAVCGRPDPANARYVLECLRRAVQACLDRRLDALVTTSSCNLSAVAVRAKSRVVVSCPSRTVFRACSYPMNWTVTVTSLPAQASRRFRK